MNVVMLIGRLVADPELKYTPSGVAVCTFRIAVDRRGRSETGEQQTDFIDIVAWRQLAELVANYMGKGRLVGVQGRLQIRSWVQPDGQRRSKAEVVADQIQFLDKPKEAQLEQPAAVGAPEDLTVEPIMDIGEPDMDYDPFAEE